MYIEFKASSYLWTCENVAIPQNFMSSYLKWINDCVVTLFLSNSVWSKMTNTKFFKSVSFLFFLLSICDIVCFPFWFAFEVGKYLLIEIIFDKLSRASTDNFIASSLNYDFPLFISWGLFLTDLTDSLLSVFFSEPFIPSFMFYGLR